MQRKIFIILALVAAVAIGAVGEYWFSHRTSQHQVTLRVGHLSQNMQVGQFDLTGVGVNSSTGDIKCLITNNGKSVKVNDVEIYEYSSGALINNLYDLGAAGGVGGYSLRSGNSQVLDLVPFNSSQKTPDAYEIVVGYR